MHAILDLIPQSSTLQGFFHPLLDELLVLDAIDTQPVGHVLENGFGEWVRFLKDHADPTAQ